MTSSTISSKNKNIEVKFGLPSNVEFCKSCVISNQRPSSTVEFYNTIEEKKKTINFDQNGICDACKWTEYKNKNVDWEKKK